MKIVTIVGARPQFIKAAAVSRILRKSMEELLIHTGQHYDSDMSDIFFSEMEIPKPDYNLSIGSDSHAKQTGNMMIGIEEILLQENPDAVLVYGDTNSTLAGALAAVKLHLPIIHVEAGLRSYNRGMPEEINRILTDCISTHLFCPTDTAKENLLKEGIVQNVHVIGDVMCDAVLYYSRRIETMNSDDLFKGFRGMHGEKVSLPERWYLATIHRAENTDNLETIRGILDGMNQLDETVIFPVHPRTRILVKQLTEGGVYENLLFVNPVGYYEMLYLIRNAVKVITDSGGLQKEAYILHTPCITVRAQTEWVETLQGNQNVLAKPTAEDICTKVLSTEINDKIHPDYYGDGDAAEKLVRILSEI